MMILKHKFTIYVTSTNKMGHKIPDDEVSAAIKCLSLRMEAAFGGCTAMRGLGHFDGVCGDVYMITSFCTDCQHEQEIDSMMLTARELRDSMEQNVIAMEIDNEMIIQ